MLGTRATGGKAPASAKENADIVAWRDVLFVSFMLSRQYSLAPFALFHSISGRHRSSPLLLQ